MNYYVLGSLFGQGRRKRASQHDIWNDLRSLAYFGICDAERKSKQFDSAIRYCQSALRYDARDPYAHFALAASYMDKAINDGIVAELDPALKHFQEVLAINPNLDEAGYAKKNIENIQKLMSAR